MLAPTAYQLPFRFHPGSIIQIGSATNHWITPAAADYPLMYRENAPRSEALRINPMIDQDRPPAPAEVPPETAEALRLMVAIARRAAEKRLKEARNEE